MTAQAGPRRLARTTPGRSRRVPSPVRRTRRTPASPTGRASKTSRTPAPHREVSCSGKNPATPHRASPRPLYVTAAGPPPPRAKEEGRFQPARASSPRPTGLPSAALPRVPAALRAGGGRGDPGKFCDVTRTSHFCIFPTYENRR